VTGSKHVITPLFSSFGNSNGLKAIKTKPEIFVEAFYPNVFFGMIYT
jgi:hypothetical protein